MTKTRSNSPSPTEAPGGIVSQEECVELFEQLASIPGPSGKEKPVADYIIARLKAAGAPDRALLTSPVSPASEESQNLILRLDGSSHEGMNRRLFVAHMDSALNCLGTIPKRNGEYIVSHRASSGIAADNRGGCAVLLASAMSLLRSNQPHPPITFLWTVREESGLLGAKEVPIEALGDPGIGFNFDGSSAKTVIHGANGAYTFEATIKGISSHAAIAPERGVSALTVAATAIALLHRGGWLGRVEKRGRYGTSNISYCAALDETNVVNEIAVLRGEVRSHDQLFRKRILDRIERALTESARKIGNAEGRSATVAIRSELDFESFLLGRHDTPVKLLADALRSTGEEPLFAVSDSGLDANVFNARGIPTATLGVGQEGGHSAQARLNIAEFLRACRVGITLAASQPR